MTFKDINFVEHSFGDGFSSHTEIGKFTLSVQCGHRNYCTPRESLASPEQYSSFEIAIWETNGNGDWATRQFIDVDDDVAGWQSREDIEEVIQKMLTHE
jgi:hypothetical protein